MIKSQGIKSMLNRINSIVLNFGWNENGTFSLQRCL
nr:MAG TPA: hypothetical protein [Caudoviricetes sp.]